MGTDTIIPFLPLLLLLIFGRQVWRLLKEPEVRAAALAAVLLLSGGTVIYHHLEGWGWVDSLYFTTVTTATIGYGDLHPTTSTTRLFTVIFAIVGIGILGSFLGAISRSSARNQRQRIESHGDGPGMEEK